MLNIHCWVLLVLRCQGNETTVELELGGEKFSVQGLMITAKNYLEVYVYDKWNAKVIFSIFKPDILFLFW